MSDIKGTPTETGLAPRNVASPSPCRRSAGSAAFAGGLTKLFTGLAAAGVIGFVSLMSARCEPKEFMGQVPYIPLTQPAPIDPNKAPTSKPATQPATPAPKTTK